MIKQYEQRSTAPTDDEIDFHADNGGSWLTNRGIVHIRFGDGVMLEWEFPECPRKGIPLIKWWIPLDRDDVPCEKWPAIC